MKEDETISSILNQILEWTEGSKGNRATLMIATEQDSSGNIETCAVLPNSSDFAYVLAAMLNKKINEPQAMKLMAILNKTLSVIVESADDMTFASIFPVDLQGSIVARTKAVIKNIKDNVSK